MIKHFNLVLILSLFVIFDTCNNPASSKNEPPVDLSGWWHAVTITETEYSVQGKDSVKTLDTVISADTVVSIYKLRRDSLFEYYNAQVCYSIWGHKITVRSNNDWYVDTAISVMGNLQTVFDSLIGRDTTIEVIDTITDISYFAMQSGDVTRNIKTIQTNSNSSGYDLSLKSERLEKYPDTTVPSNWPASCSP